MAMKMRALRKMSINAPVNPEAFVEQHQDVAPLFSGNKSVNIEFSQWKRVSVDDKGKRKWVMRIVTESIPQEEFILILQKESNMFREHVCRVKAQYSA